MADRTDDVIEEVSSSHGRQVHEEGESSRPPQFIPLLDIDHAKSKVFGICATSSSYSASGVTVLVDDFSRYTCVSFLKLKSEAFGSIRDWKAMVKKEKDLKVKSIRSDRGGEFLSENFARWCKSEGIRRQLTTPYTPSQNGVVERKNRTIMEMARAMLAHASLPRSYWAEACNTAVYIRNRSPTHALQDMTPFQAYYGRKPTVSHFRVFGCSAFVHIPKEKRQKLDFKSRKLLFLGYSAESDAYRLYDPDTRTTTVSRDVVFDESFITSAEGAAAQPIPILPPPSLPDPPASPVITPSTSHPVPPIQPRDVSPDHALSDSDSDLDVADATPEVDLAPPRREKRIHGWLYSTIFPRYWLSLLITYLLTLVIASSSENTLFNIERLDGTNYSLSKEQIYNVLVQNKQIKPITLKGVKPENIQQADWEGQ
ncbi:hypothetical protein L7F22_026422 [Adiantum nelumboides]|nr:hypothetical protein [Adiantum nelumboides]